MKKGAAPLTRRAAQLMENKGRSAKKSRPYCEKNKKKKERRRRERKEGHIG